MHFVLFSTILFVVDTTDYQFYLCRLTADVLMFNNLAKLFLLNASFQVTNILRPLKNSLNGSVDKIASLISILAQQHWCINS